LNLMFASTVPKWNLKSNRSPRSKPANNPGAADGIKIPVMIQQVETKM
jgi:hypothetical protein